MGYTHLAISGGGTKGISCLGSLMYLDKCGCLKDVTHYLGTSVGSIICLFLVVFDIQYLVENIHIFTCLNYNDIDLRLFIKQYGIISKKPLIDNIHSLLYNHFKYEISFADLFSITKKELTITALNLYTKNIEYFNHRNAPNMKVIDAIKLSINIPLFFEMEKHNNIIYVDAGLVNNISWEFFAHIENNKKLGIYMASKNTQCDSISTFVSYLFNVLQSMFIYAYNTYESNVLDKNIILLKDTTSIFDISPSQEKIKDLLSFGYSEAQLYLKKTI